LDSNSPNVCWWSIITVLEVELAYPFYRELVNSCLSFQRDKSLLNRSSITPDIVKNLRRGQTVTVPKGDSNGWTGTVQMFVDEQFSMS
jgi:hypothetical protein